MAKSSDRDAVGALPPRHEWRGFTRKLMNNAEKFRWSSVAALRSIVAAFVFVVLMGSHSSAFATGYGTTPSTPSNPYAQYVPPSGDYPSSTSGSTPSNPYAQYVPPQNAGKADSVGTGMDASGFTGIFQSLENTSPLTNAANDIAGRIKSGVAMKLIGILAVLAFTLNSLKMALSDSPNKVIGDMIDSILSIGLFAWFMLNYSTFSGAVISLMTAVTSAVNNTSFAQSAGQLAGVSGQLLDAAVSIVKGVHLFSSLSTILNQVLTSIFLGIAALAMILSGFIYILMGILGDALTAIAVAVGPFFVALGVWEVTRPYFKAWLTFFTSSLGIKLVATVVMVLMEGMIKIVVDGANNAGSSALGALGTVIDCFALDYIMLQVPMVAGTLFGAGLGAAGGITGHASSRADTLMGKRGSDGKRSGGLAGAARSAGSFLRNKLS